MQERDEEGLRRAILALGRLTESFSERRVQLARGVGLSEQQWRLLEEIETQEFLPSLFARRRARTPASVSKVLRQLLDQELVSVSVSSVDARRRSYALTGRGRRALRRLRTSRELALDRIWRGLNARDVARFADFSEKLADRLEAYARSSKGGSRSA